jgi:hypothetical protein
MRQFTFSRLAAAGPCDTCITWFLLVILDSLKIFMIVTYLISLITASIS